ncbi:hypothetical protein D3C83_47930 [compost metagenome]
MFTPAATLKSSPAMWMPTPVPPEPKFILPGRDFASATSCFTDFAGTLGCTSSTYGAAATWEIATRSFCGSYGVLGLRWGTMASGPEKPNSSV